MRRFVSLGAAGLTALSLVSAAASEHTEIIAAFNPALGEFPEGVAVDLKGNVYVSLAPLGQVRKIAPDGSQTVLATFAKAPTALGVLGLNVDPVGNVYAAVASGLPHTHGVWRIPPEAAPERSPGSEAIFFPNAVTFDPRGHLYVTETSGPFNGQGFGQGAVWRIPRGGSAELWLRHELLTGAALTPGGVPLGANGITYHGNNIYVANTARKHVVRIAILPDGSPGTPEVAFAFTGPIDFLDGIDSDVFGNLYLALPARYELAMITHDDLQVITLATALDAVDFPASVAVGEIRGGQQHVYVTSFAIGPSLGFPPGAGPSVMRVAVGVRP